MSRLCKTSADETAFGAPLRMVGYIRVSTEEQGISGAGLESQRQAIEGDCLRKGWELVATIEDVASGRDPGTIRPSISAKD